MTNRILYTNNGITLDSKRFFSKVDPLDVQSTIVFSDASEDSRAMKRGFGVVIGRCAESNQQIYSGKITTAIDTQGAEAEAMRQGILYSTGNIILVTDNSEVADFAASVLRREPLPHRFTRGSFIQPAMVHLRDALIENHERIDALCQANRDKFPEQEQADAACRAAIDLPVKAVRRSR